MPEPVAMHFQERMERLRRREQARFGERLFPGGICTSSLKRFWGGQRRMMREGWTSGGDNGMTSGSASYRIPFSALKGSTPLRSTAPVEREHLLLAPSTRCAYASTATISSVCSPG
jgi:hypothetical protein